MSGEPWVTKSAFVQVPVGGMNVTDPATLLPANQCADVLDYYCYNGTLKARGTIADGSDLGSGQNVEAFFNWHDASGNEILVGCSSDKLWTFTSLTSATDSTNSMTITSPAYSAVAFNDYLLLVNGTNAALKLNRSMTLSLGAWTGVTDSLLTQVWTYNERAYFVRRDSFKYYYGAVDAITGTLTEIDLASQFTIPSTLLFGTSWSYNQGVTTEHYCVFVSAAGEVLIYAGNYPDAPNWQIIGRTQIAEPLGKNSFIKIGGDVLVYTKAGIAKLSDVIASSADSPSLYATSDAINKYFQRGKYPSAARAWLAVNKQLPFFYMTGEANSGRVWVFNYRTGAWSHFYFEGGSDCIAFAFDKLVLAQGRYVRSVATSSTYGQNAKSIKSAWQNFGSLKNKRLVAVRALLSAASGSDTSTTTYDLRVFTDFHGLDTGFYESDTKTITADSDSEQIFVVEFVPSITGKWLQFELLTNDSTSAIDEFHGLEVFYEEGGVY